MPRYAVDAAGQRNLDDEADERHVDAAPVPGSRDRVGVLAPLAGGRRHVELLLDDRGADRRKPDDHRDDLQVRGDAAAGSPRAPLTPSSSPVLRRSLVARPLLAADDRPPRAARQTPCIAALTSSRFVGADRARPGRRQRAPATPPRLEPAADEPEDALRLARVVDVVGERPELADEEDAEDQAEQVEADRRPSCWPRLRTATQKPPAAPPCRLSVTGIIQRRGSRPMTLRCSPA